MACLTIRQFPDSVLRMPCESIAHIDQNIQELIDDMIETMITAPGVGLAAPQVGSSVRLIVYDGLTSSDDINHVINPEIVSQEGALVDEEGCLSLPEIFAKVKRFEQVVVKGLDRNGKEIQVQATGRVSSILQHEIDHLNGVLFWDRVGRAKKDILKRKFNKIKEKDQ